jgi:hypothetical protein
MIWELLLWIIFQQEEQLRLKPIVALRRIIIYKDSKTNEKTIFDKTHGKKFMGVITS